MIKAILDKRICDVEQNATNTETYREFMIYAFHEIYGNNAKIPDLDNMQDEELDWLLNDLDYLLSK